MPGQVIYALDSAGRISRNAEYLIIWREITSKSGVSPLRLVPYPMLYSGKIASQVTTTIPLPVAYALPREGTLLMEL